MPLTPVRTKSSRANSSGWGGGTAKILFSSLKSQVKAVTWKSRALECDSCKTWYHVDCQGQMSDTMYSIMDNSNISWNCLKCGLPNFSSTFFNQRIPSSLSANFFSVLSCNSPGEPFATSSPKSIHSHSSLYHHNSTTHRGYHTNRKCKTVNSPLRIISLNFQSINKQKNRTWLAPWYYKTRCHYRHWNLAWLVNIIFRILPCQSI